MQCLILVLIALVATFCEAEEKFYESTRNSSIELIYASALPDGTAKDVVISPFGAFNLLGGLSVGTSGKTNKEILVAFRASRKWDLVELFSNLRKRLLSQSNGATLTSKNYMFIDVNTVVFKDFTQTVEKDFDFQVKKLNFDDPNVVDEANNIVKARGVNKMFDGNDFAKSRIIMANVLKFEGFWTKPFNSSDTSRQPFFNENGEVIGQVDMMNVVDQFAGGLIKELNAVAIELPYGTDEKYSMFILMPREGDVTDMYKKLVGVSLVEVLDRLRKNIEVVDVKIPRFRKKSNVILIEPFKFLGIYSLFDSGHAEFANLSNTPLHVTAFAQQIDIEVTESGTTALSTTKLNFAERHSVQFEANRPFVYFIIEKSTSSIVFGGVFTDPS